MRAITYARYGPPDVLKLREIAKPSPGADELLIRVHAAEATKADCELRSFHYAVKWFWLPLRLAIGLFRPRRQVLGGYFAGIVETVGEQVTTFSPGQRVFGCTSLSFGAYAEYVVLPARYTIVAMPENMSFTEAAAVPLGGLNALHFLRRAGIASGERVLVNGAGGSIGAHAVQIAKAMGAEVTAVDAAHKRDMLIDIGADRFVDYAREHFADDGRRYDVVLDMVPGKACRDCIAALAPRGRYFSGNPTIAVMLRCLTTSLLTDKRASFAFARESLEELETLKAMVERGEIVSIVDTALPMSRAAEAHRRVEAEQRCGAIVLDLTAAS